MTVARWALFVVLLVLSAACAVANYPVVTDTRGVDQGAVLTSFYDQAYLVPSSRYAAIWPDGSDDLFTLLTQDWTGDQWLYTYNNFDPTGSGMVLDDTYCDPTRQTDCWVARAWNPNLPDWSDLYGEQPPGTDDEFDYDVNASCSGARSLQLLLDFESRLGECGSGLWADKQGLLQEFSLLAKRSWRGRDWYHVPIDASVASFVAHGADGSEAPMPVYGRFNLYLDERLHGALPITPNMKYQLRWLDAWSTQHGPVMDLDVTYGSLQARFKTRLLPMKAAIERL